MAASKKKAVSKKEKVTALPAVLMEGFEGDAGGGMEGTDFDSFAVPFLVVLQSMSPQCKKSDGAYIEGAEEGMIFNTASGEVFDGEEGVMLVPFAYRRAIDRE